MYTYECRSDERLKAKTEGFTRLAYTCLGRGSWTDPEVGNCSSPLFSKVGLALAKAAALRVTLSLGVPVPRATQCMRDA
jgi:hypothetical protein